MYVGKLIKERREKINASQHCIAGFFGYSSGQYISNIERGVCSFPLGKARSLRKLLGINKHEMQDAYRKDFEEKISQI